MPNESIRFEWVANYPGVYIYHCGVPPVLQHVAMGQYGMVIVSPREGYATDAKVDREYAVVQSEFYLKPGTDDLFVLDFEAAAKKNPSHVLFNGHQAALTERPLEAFAGERVGIRELEDGRWLVSFAHIDLGIVELGGTPEFEPLPISLQI